MSWQNIPNWHVSTASHVHIMSNRTEAMQCYLIGRGGGVKFHNMIVFIQNQIFHQCLPSQHFYIWHDIFVHRSLVILRYDAPLLWNLKLHLVVTRRYRFFVLMSFGHTRNIAVNDIFSRGVTNEPIHISPWLQHRLPLHIITTRGHICQ